MFVNIEMRPILNVATCRFFGGVFGASPSEHVRKIAKIVSQTKITRPAECPVLTLSENVRKNQKSDAFQVLMGKKPPAQKVGGARRPARQLSLEQQAVLHAKTSGTRNIFVSAVAGSGKTTTVESMIRASPTERALYLCFNKANVKEAKKRLKGLKHVTCSTLNALGLNALGAQTDKDKVNKHFKYPRERKAIDRLMAMGYIPDNYASLLTDEQAIECIANIPAIRDPAYIFHQLKPKYKAMLDDNATCSFGEQVLLPALLDEISFQGYDTVYIDEAQDLSELNMCMIAKIPHKRLIGVGDRRQAIYAFRGAHNHAVDAMIDKFDMVEMHLSRSFRCKDNIAKHAGIVGIEQGGIVRNGTRGEIQAGDTVLCRNNAPLVRLAIELMKRGLRVCVRGDHTGAGLLEALSKSRKTKKVAELRKFIADPLQFFDTDEDTRELLLCVLDSHKTVAKAIDYLQSLKAGKEDAEAVKLMTIHRSKGMEWEKVFVLDADIISSEEQDPNLLYVAKTRAINKLVYV